MNQPLANCKSLEPTSIPVVLGNNMSESAFVAIIDTADYTDTSLYVLDNQVYVTIPFNSPQLLKLNGDAYAVLSYDSITWIAVRIKAILSNSLLMLDTSTLTGDITLYTFTGISYPQYRYVKVFSDDDVMQVQGETFVGDLTINSNNVIAPFVVLRLNAPLRILLFS